MKMLIFLFIGPILVLIGCLGSYGFIFWLGSVICAFILFMNVASGILKFPIIPIIIIMFCLPFFKQWYVGVAVGLALWTAFEAVGQVYVRLRR